MLSSVEIAALKGGTAYDLIYDNVDILYSVTYNSVNWSEGLSSDLSTADQLKATEPTGGTWEVAIPIGSLATTIDAGIHLTYEGSGVTMSYSLDGTTWTVATNRRTVLEGTNVANSIFFVRLALADDTAYVDSLTVDVLRTRVMAPASGVRQLTFTKTAMDQTPAHQSNLGPDDGAVIVPGGYMEILPDTSDLPVTTKTIEFWLKKNSTANSIVFDDNAQRIRLNNNIVTYASPMLSVKINGVTAASAGSTTITLNQWHFFQVTLATPDNNLIRIGTTLTGTDPSDINVYGLAVYPSAPTNTYEANMGLLRTRIDDASTITMTERAPVVDIYAYTWTNSGT